MWRVTTTCFPSPKTSCIPDSFDILPPPFMLHEIDNMTSQPKASTPLFPPHDESHDPSFLRSRSYKGFRIYAHLKFENEDDDDYVTMSTTMETASSSLALYQHYPPQSIKFYVNDKFQYSNLICSAITRFLF